MAKRRSITRRMFGSRGAQRHVTGVKRSRFKKKGTGKFTQKGSFSLTRLRRAKAGVKYGRRK